MGKNPWKLLTGFCVCPALKNYKFSTAIQEAWRNTFTLPCYQSQSPLFDLCPLFISHYLLDPFGCTDESFPIIGNISLGSSPLGNETLETCEELCSFQTGSQIQEQGTSQATGVQQDVTLFPLFSLLFDT